MWHCYTRLEHFLILIPRVSRKLQPQTHYLVCILLHCIILYCIQCYCFVLFCIVPTCEAVLGVAPVALHPGEGECAQAAGGAAAGRSGAAPAAQRPVSGHTDDSGGGDIRSGRIHAHIHVVSSAEGPHPAGPRAAAIPGIHAAEAPGAAASNTTPCAAIGRRSVF